MTISIVNVGSTAEADNAVVSSSWGATPINGDVGVICASIKTGTVGRTLSVDGSWTQLVAYGASGNSPMYIWVKGLSPGEAPSDVTPAGGATGNVIQVIPMLLRGAETNTAQILDGTPQTASTTASNATPIPTDELTITEDNCIGIMFCSNGLDASSFGTFNPNGISWTQQRFTSTTTGTNQCVALYTRIFTTAEVVEANDVGISGQATGAIARSSILALNESVGVTPGTAYFPWIRAA